MLRPALAIGGVLFFMTLGIAFISFAIGIRRAVMTRGNCFAGYQVVMGLGMIGGVVFILLALGLANESWLHI